jgi:hypothetical protein
MMDFVYVYIPNEPLSPSSHSYDLHLFQCILGRLQLFDQNDSTPYASAIIIGRLWHIDCKMDKRKSLLLAKVIANKGSTVAVADNAVIKGQGRMDFKEELYSNGN